MTPTLSREDALAWWNSKTLEQKALTIGEEILDQWVLGIIEKEFDSVTKLLSKNPRHDLTDVREVV